MSKAPYKLSGNTISSVSTVVGITLVLTMLGVLIVFLLIAKDVSKHVREGITIQIMLNDGVKEQDILLLRKEIEGQPYAGSVKYISSEEAAERFSKELGEDFVGFLGENPLPASLEVQINPDFTRTDSLESYIAPLGENEWVRDIDYQKGLLNEINENIAKWGLGLSIVGAVFLIMAVVLIINTIELAIFSQRFIIRSMQLVGATHWFIQKPFLLRGLLFGLIASFCSLAMISGLLLYFQKDLPIVITVLTNGFAIAYLFLGVFLCGLLVSGVATAFAVRRFILIHPDKLYG
jgi:cell division transport system permease protein